MTTKELQALLKRLGKGPRKTKPSQLDYDSADITLKLAARELAEEVIRLREGVQALLKLDNYTDGLWIDQGTNRELMELEKTLERLRKLTNHKA